MDALLPLRLLVSWYYRHAPYKLGGWEGAHSADICASLTTMSAALYDKHVVECELRIQRAEDAWVVAVAISILMLIIVALVMSVPSVLRATVGGIVGCCCGNRAAAPPPPPPAPPVPVPLPVLQPKRGALTDAQKDRARETRRANDAIKKRNADIARWAETFVHYLATLPPDTTIGTMLQSYRTPLMDYFPPLANGPADGQNGGGLALLGAAAETAAETAEAAEAHDTDQE